MTTRLDVVELVTELVHESYRDEEGDYFPSQGANIVRHSLQALIDAGYQLIEPGVTVRPVEACVECDNGTLSQPEESQPAKCDWCNGTGWVVASD